MMSASGRHINDQQYRNTDKTWSIPAYDYDYDLVKSDENSDVINVTDYVALDYTNWDIPPLCYQMEYVLTSRSFIWLQNRCSTRNGALCQKKLAKIEQKVTTAVQDNHG